MLPKFCLFAVFPSNSFIREKAKRHKANGKMLGADDLDDETILSIDIDAIQTACQPSTLQHAWEDRARSMLRMHWGHEHLRDKQREAISAVLAGHDCLVLLATGRGKSVCYQLVPLITGRPTIVISPLISLMTDQVAALSSRGVHAVLLGSAQHDPLAEERAACGEYDLIYMTPEKLQAFNISRLQSLRGISLIAVDEAHCVCEWGFDFRPSYAAIGNARPRGVPLMALTATAPPFIRAQMCESLRIIAGSPWVKGELSRPNLHYSVRRKGADAAADVLPLLTPPAGATIIYVATVRHQT